jgi:hypothetical protein
MARQKKFLSYKGVDLYRAKKGNVEKSVFFALLPNQEVEGHVGFYFDIRLIPQRYRSGFDLSRYLSDEDYCEILRRAIDDKYDFDAATRGLYGQYVRRLLRWINESGKQRSAE